MLLSQSRDPAQRVSRAEALSPHRAPYLRAAPSFIRGRLTALHYAVMCSHEALAKLLVAKGARVDIPDANGDTPSASRPGSWASWWPAAEA